MTRISMFDPFQIGKLTIKNRLVRSATFEFAGENYKITPRMVELYRVVAEGGCGLVISGMQAVSTAGAMSPLMVDITHQYYIGRMREMARSVHDYGGRLFAQINYVGDCNELSEKEIQDIAEAFGVAAKRAREAYCDGVQIHAAHGFLINRFLSPYFNHRTDSYGGDLSNRARMLFAVYDAARAAVGKDYALSVKIPFSDLVTPSITPEECLFLCKKLEERGINMIEVSSGVTKDGGETSAVPRIKEGAGEGCFLAGAAQVAEAVNVPVVSVCGYRTPDYIENVLNDTKIAAIALSRPLIREPYLPTRWQHIDRGKATCISCNECFKSERLLSCQRLKPQED